MKGRRLIYLAMIVAVSVPVLLGFSLPPSRLVSAERMYSVVDEMQVNPGEVAFVWLDFGPGTLAENEPQAQVLLEHLHFSALLLGTTDVALDGTAADGTATEGINIGGGGPFGGGTATGLGFGSGFGADCRPIGVGFPVVGAATLTLADGTATQGINIGGGGPVSSGGPFGGGTATGLGFGSGGGGAC